MKAGVVALALVGSALADYWPAASSSPAAAVKPSAHPEDCDDDVTTSADAWPVKGAKTTTSSTTATWPTPSWSADPEDCDDDESASWSKGASWSHKPKTTTTTASTEAWPVKGATTTTTVPGAWPTWSAAPSYFDPTLAWGCCKTVVTVTEWATAEASPVTWTTKTTSTPAAPVWSDPAWSSPAWSSPAAPAVPTWSSPAAPVKPTTTWSEPAAAWSSPAATWSSPAAPASSSYSTITPKGNKWAITYTPYTTSGQCQSADQVDSDLAKIASWGFTTVRIYATDCSALTNVGGSAKKHGLKIILGVFIESSGLQAAWSQVDDITAWGSAGNWDIVSLIVVGNEAVFNGYCSASDLAGYISKAKGAWSAAGYTGPVTTTEPVNIIQQWGSTLCAVVDVAAANIQAYFTSSVSSAWAGSFVQSQLALVEAACPGKTAYNLESGWPSAGGSNGAAIASPSDQAAAINDIIAKAGDVSVIFSFENDAWKEPGSLGVEQYFGCGSVF